MPDDPDAPKKNPQRYEIAEPLSYSAFSLDPRAVTAQEPESVLQTILVLPPIFL
jgi:hypothetical protein